MDEKKLSNLLQKGKELQKKAYVPYSNFRVAAIVGLQNKQEVSGVNVENAAFPVAICAERTALAQVVTLGYHKNEMEFLFLITDSKTIGSPCGVCRQFMAEIMPLDSKVYIANSITTDIKDITIITIKDLLPYAFSAQSLKGNE